MAVKVMYYGDSEALEKTYETAKDWIVTEDEHLVIGDKAVYATLAVYRRGTWIRAEKV